MARSDFRKGDLPYLFVAMPKDVLHSPEWQSLPTAARALALDLMGQYTGKNNGRLCPSITAMKRCGWNENTLIRAKRALLERPFAVLTRKGHAPRTAEWIGFTWWKLDWEKSMDIGPRDFPFLNFLKMETPDPNTGRRELLKTNSDLQKLQRCPQRPALRPAETAVMPAPRTPQ